MTLSTRMESMVDEMLQKGITLEQAVQELERRYIAKALDQASGCKTDAAKLLGLHRNTLASKIASQPGQRKTKRRGVRSIRRNPAR